MNPKEWQSILGLLKLTRYTKYDHRYGRQIRKSRLQTCVLNYVFEITRFPSTSTIIDLALLINIHPKSIQKWFQNTRQTAKRKGNEEEDKSYENNIVDLPIPTLYNLMERAKKNC
ncbi:homeobox domain-containing protein [Vairimorpha ceranae]|uniref:Homeobox domain-containing protein n=1 Tax=Vairimorpha ceranae TaxID=40302 RepID=A0A0F9WDL9_9MICR|nr:homeobox domain-containing protein [Vairimorpha ceranae]KKO75531.1 homeobox domain-containing protein [Vairimorpha ceranae]